MKNLVVNSKIGNILMLGVGLKKIDNKRDCYNCSNLACSLMPQENKDECHGWKSDDILDKL